MERSMRQNREAPKLDIPSHRIERHHPGSGWIWIQFSGLRYRVEATAFNERFKVNQKSIEGFYWNFNYRGNYFEINFDKCDDEAP